MTSKFWPQVALSEVLELNIDAVPVDASAIYPIAGVYSFGKGLLVRSPLPGTETTYKVFHRLHKDDFVLSQLKAWEGALARVTEQFDGWYLSPQFPTFRAKAGKLDIAYLEWYCKQSKVWNQLRSSARGMGARRDSVSPSKFLSMIIPFPPLAEQQRIVTRIEELSAKIEEARGLRRQAVEEAKALIASESARIFESLGDNYPIRQFGEYKPHVTSGPRNWGKYYQEKGIRFYRAQDIGNNGKISTDTKVFVSQPPSGQGLSAILRPGDLMFVITGATVGRCAVYDDSLEPGIVSQHVSICRLPADNIFPEYALWGMRSPIGQSQLLGQTYGQGKPGLNLTNIRALSLPIPPLPEQRRIVTYLDNLQAKVDCLKRIQAETTTELDAMLPSILDKAFKGEL